VGWRGIETAGAKEGAAGGEVEEEKDGGRPGRRGGGRGEEEETVAVEMRKCTGFPENEVWEG
jgi:hypothetical protein